MDSQENILNQSNLECEKQVNEVANTENATEMSNEQAAEAEQVATQLDATDLQTDGDCVEEIQVFETKTDIVARLKHLVINNLQPSKKELDLLKTTFYKLHKAEREAQQKDYIDNGGDAATYQAIPDEQEEMFKAQMQVIKERRAQQYLQAEQEKQDNLQKKLAIIEKIKGMATSPEEANKSFPELKILQQEWKDIKAVPAEKANELWRNYQLYVEQFYDLLNLNREAREYDFKKNLELKTKLCEAAEGLDAEEDAISAFHQLQELHQQYREIGPVAKEVREEIWQRFKAASTVINKKHQQHFEQLRASEEENLTKKTALCEKAEAILTEEIKSPADWDKLTKEIINLQKQWKETGFAPQKMNVKIFERFRLACDTFFANKAEFFKKMKETFALNAEKKKTLIEKAQALSESTNWKSTTDKLIELQKEWKTIGVVPKKQSDKLWNEFNTACNNFFENRNKVNAGARNEEHANLGKKKEIIEKLNVLYNKASETTQEMVQALVEEYNKVGHVPYKEKDKLFNEFHEVLDKIYANLNIAVTKRRLDNFKNNLKTVAKRGEDALDNERNKLMYRYEQLKAEIITYENNLGFLTASSKKGNSLLDEMNRKVQKLKDECKLIYEKIKAIDAENKEEKQVQE